MRNYLVIVSLVAGLYIPASKAGAATYYVDQSSPAASDSAPGRVTAPWKTIGKATGAAKPGDTVVVRAGSYDEAVTPLTAGTPDKPIVYTADPPPKPMPKVRRFNISKDYITINGFEITSAGFTTSERGPGVSVAGATGVHITDNHIHHVADGAGITFGNATFLTIRANRLDHLGTNAFAGGGAAALTGVFRAPCSDVLIEENTLSFASDYLNPYGTRFVFRNNTIGPSDQTNSHHIDGIQPNGDTSDSLMEGNISVDNQGPDNHFFLNQNAPSTGWIIRHNVVYRSKGMLDWRNAGRHHFYNNTFHETYKYYVANGQILLTNSTGNIARNNIWYRAVGPRGNPYLGDSLDKDYDLCFDGGNTGEAHAVAADPQFVDAAKGDFHLRRGSPAIDRGGPLTTAANAGQRSTSLRVGAVGLFQPGWAGVSADWIAVGSSTNAAQIASIDYASNTLTLATPLTWKQGDPVHLFKNSQGEQVLHGAAPDIGAYEFKVGVVRKR